MCNITNIKANKNANFLLKNKYLLKSYIIFNIKCKSFSTNLLFKLFNMYKFVHDRKTLNNP